MVDFHTHILPAVDDGSRTVEQSLRMLQMERAQGIETVFCTPHFYPQDEQLEDFLARRQTAIAQLSDAMEAHPDLPALQFGAEVAYYENMSHSKQLRELCVGNTEILLIELPFSVWNTRVFQDIERIADAGMQPLIAHIERYLPLQPRKKDALMGLKSAGATIQSNAEFFLQGWRSHGALQLLRKGEIDVLASDCHNLTSRKPNLQQAVQVIEQKIGAQALQQVNHKSNRLLGKVPAGML